MQTFYILMSNISFKKSQSVKSFTTKHSQVSPQNILIKIQSCHGSLLLVGIQWLHLHLHGSLLAWLGGGRAAGCSLRLLRRHPGVEGTHQPVERRVIDQIIHDVVQGIFHFAQLHFAAGQHAVWQVSQHFSLAEAGVDLCGRAAEGEHLLLDVVGEALHAGDEDQAGGLELLSEGTCQGQSARLNYLDGGNDQI